MFIGIDLGTSSIKTILIDDNQKIIGNASISIGLLNPKSGFFEQEPDSWFKATLKCFEKLKKELNQNIQILETYKKETKELQENVKKLKIETLDLDYLDEVARDKHDLSKPDENIIFNKF
mgnify:CR=1 FL=1